MSEARKPSIVRRFLQSIGRCLLLFAAFVCFFWITGCMERMFYHPEPGPTPPPPNIGAEGVWFTSADGTRLYGWFIPAVGVDPAAAERRPTILHAHGNAGNVLSHAWFTEYLPDAGFNLFIFDYRGYGQSEGSSSRRRKFIEDTDAALDAILARKDVDPQRIGLYGHSLGGAIGINVMADRPEIRAAVLESPFASWRDEAANAVGGDSPGPFYRMLAAILISDSHRPLDAMTRIANDGLGRSVLILHGDVDSLIPVSHGRRLAAAGGGGTCATLIELAKGDHNSLRDTHPEIEQHTIDFFRSHLRSE
jgi:uncharacterized protein